MSEEKKENTDLGEQDLEQVSGGSDALAYNFGGIEGAAATATPKKDVIRKIDKSSPHL